MFYYFIKVRWKVMLQIKQHRKLNLTSASGQPIRRFQRGKLQLVDPDTGRTTDAATGVRLIGKKYGGPDGKPPSCKRLYRTIVNYQVQFARFPVAAPRRGMALTKAFFKCGHTGCSPV